MTKVHCCIGSYYDVPCTQDCQAKRAKEDAAAWAAYSRAWPEAICGYEFYHADELAEAKERALALTAGRPVSAASARRRSARRQGRRIGPGRHRQPGPPRVRQRG